MRRTLKLRTQLKPSEQRETADEFYYKVTKTFTDGYLHPSQHQQVMQMIDSKIRRPQSSHNLKKDYRVLKELVNCNQRIYHHRQRSMLSYKKMQSINNTTTCQQFFKPLQAEIKKSELSISKKKYEKCDLGKFQRRLQKKQFKQESIEAFIESVLFQGMRDLKNWIPLEAKVHQKLNIFGELSEEDKEKYLLEIKQFLIKTMKNDEKQITVNEQIYLINYFLIQKMMEKIYIDTKTLEQKKKHRELYKFIKDQMVGELVNEKGFAKVLQLIQKYYSNLQKQNNKCKIYRPKKLTKTTKSTSQFQSNFPLHNNQAFSKNKENDITKQFQKYYVLAKQKIEEAEIKLAEAAPKKSKTYFTLIGSFFNV